MVLKKRGGGVKKAIVNPKLISKFFRKFLNAAQRIQFYYGGSSSGKSTTFMMFAVLWMVQGRTIAIMTKLSVKIKDSTWPEVLDAIDRFGLAGEFDIRIGDRDIIHKSSGGRAIFRGLDKESKIKSVKVRSSPAIDTIICEEVTDFTFDDIKQLMTRQRGETKFPKRFIGLFNPILITHHIYTSFFKEIAHLFDFNSEDFTVAEYSRDVVLRRTGKVVKQDILICKSTYLDNEFLSEEDEATLESYKESSKYHYQVYCLGNFGVLGDRIFDDNLFDIDHEDIPTSGVDLRCGLDFGFNDPNAFVITKYDRARGNIYIITEFVDNKLSNEKICARIIELFNFYNIPVNTRISAESADPKSISALSELGLSIEKAEKHVFSQIMWLKLNSIYISKKSKNGQTDLGNYAWKKDKKTGLSIDEPDHSFSHLPDALRYAYWREAAQTGSMQFTHNH
jgi:phage terminase large subunit